MNKIQGNKLVTILVALMFVAMAFVGCNSDRFNSVAGPETVQTQDAPGDMPEPSNLLGRSGQYPQSAFKVLNFLRFLNIYTGGLLQVPNGTAFIVQPGALTPPPGTPLGLPVPITMHVDENPNGLYGYELLYTFGPSGSAFAPAAEMWVDWRKMGPNPPSLYYVDKFGNYTPVAPDVIDYQNKKIKFLIPHFSRYALVHA